jgi:hypothetical protein
MEYETHGGFNEIHKISLMLLHLEVFKYITL